MNNQVIIKWIDENNYARYIGAVTGITEISGEKIGDWNGRKVAWLCGIEWHLLPRNK